MTKTEFLTKLATRLADYDFCATLLDDDWSERMSERAHAYLTDDEDAAIDKIEDDAEAGEIRCEAIQMVLDAFLWYQIKNRLGQDKLKKHIKVLTSLLVADTGSKSDLLAVKDYLVTLTNGAVLFESKS